MKRKLKWICLLFIVSNIFYLSAADAQQLSDKAAIHIVTCGPYQTELYSAFGHSGIRVYDPENKIDWFYNYGVFDFNQPNFYLNFARGYLHYKLAVFDYNPFKAYYIRQNRFIHEQVLNLNQQQKQQLFDFLEWNAAPENQYYYYDYFYDNCATRVRDALKNTFDDQIVFDGTYIDTDYTIRELTDVYLQHQPWGDLGIDICLGLPMDKKATPDMYMFLPDYIERAFDHAVIKTDSATVPLVKETISTYESQPEVLASSIFTPFNVFLFILLIGIALTVIGTKKNIRLKGFDIVLFAGVGSVGLLLTLLWLATDHAAAAKNMNILWALPTHLVAGLLLLKKEKPVWLRKYFLFTALWSITLSLCWALIPQQMHLALIPVVLLLAVRGWFIYNSKEHG